MRMTDLNLDIIRQAHADDIAAYKFSGRSSPQHMHRHWLLSHITQLEAALSIKIPETDRPVSKNDKEE